jgi:hypothetical protein
MIRYLAIFLFVIAASGQAVLQNAVIGNAVIGATSGGGGGCTTMKDNYDGTTAISSTDGVIRIAGRFTAASSFTSCKVIMRLKRTGTLDGTWRAELWSSNGTAPPNALPLALLAYSDSDPAISTTAGDVTFANLSYAIQSGTSYFIVVYHSTGGDYSGDYFEPYGATASGQNTSLAADGSTWEVGDATRSLDFQLYE